MWYHNINPFLLRIYGDIGIRWYSLAYVLGFLALYFILRTVARKKSIKNLTEAAIDPLLLYLIIGVVVGARFFHVFVFEPAYYFAHPGQILMIWQGGLSFHGGLVGVAIALWLFSRKYKIKFLELSDLIAIPLGLFLMLGRIANFINGELYGTITNVSWCVDYSKSQFLLYPPEGCRHPTQLYEAGKNLLIFGILYGLYSHDIKHKKNKLGTGFYSGLFLVLYGILRFFITFLRDEPTVLRTGISEAQFLCLGMIIVGGWLLIRMRRKHYK
jgi:phosphatidylglycerol:prolipoprotein diacylglycerol transferase